MILREYIGLDTCNKNRIFVDIECEVCKKVFCRQKRQVRGHICSSLCQSIYKGTRIKVNCAHCNKEIFKQLSDFESSKSGLLFCNRECKEAAQKYIPAIQPEHYGTASAQTGYRRKAFEYYLHECTMCGYKENKAALIVHHIDEDRHNDEIDNLIILCANCHAITHWGK